MGFAVTISNPVYNFTGAGASTTVPINELEISVNDGEISALTFVVNVNVLSVYDLEISGADSNPLQCFSTIQLRRDTDVWFYGYVTEKPLLRADGNTLEVRCLGKEGVLANTFVPNGSSFVWSDATTQSTLTEQSILPITTDTTDDFSANWYPATTVAGAWYSPTGVTDALSAGIDDNDTEIPLSASYKGFVEESFVLIDTEYIFYTGYEYRTNKWYLTGCRRGALGTVAAAHLSAATATQRVAKQIAPSTIYLEYDKAGTWTDLSTLVTYQFNAKGGYFIFPYSAITCRATYDVFDTDSGALDLSDVVVIALEASASLGGAGFTAADHDITSIGVPLTRIDYSPDGITPYAWQLIQRLIELDGINDEVLFYYNHSANKFVLENIAQKAIPDLYINRIDSLIKERNIDDLYSTMLVKYSNETAINRANNDYAWRPKSDDATYPTPAWWVWDSSGKTSYDSNVVSSHALQNISTFAGPVFDGASAPAYPLEIMQFYFGVTAPSVNLEEISFTIATWGGGTWQLAVQGCADYNIAGHTGTWVDISPDLTYSAIRGNAGGSVSSAQTKTYKTTQFTTKAVNGIRVIANSIPTDLDPVRERLYFHDFKILASNSNFEVVQLVATGAGQGQVEAAASLQKIRGGIGCTTGNYGSPRGLYIDIGAASRGAAMSIAAQYLRSRLKLYEARSYVTHDIPLDSSGNPKKPELGMTVQVDEGASNYTGIIQGYTITVKYDEITYALDVLDYGAGVIA